ncbi:MAG: hypothetical protein ABI345_15355 [Jatrophihabitans sp.]
MIDVENATVHARGTLDIFTLELLRGAIANLALHHPSRITIDLSDVTGNDRSVARLLDDWQRNGVHGSTVPIDVPALVRSAASQTSLDGAKPATTDDRPSNTSSVDAARRLHGRRNGPRRELTRGHNASLKSADTKGETQWVL